MGANMLRFLVHATDINVEPTSVNLGGEFLTACIFLVE